MCQAERYNRVSMWFQFLQIIDFIKQLIIESYEIQVSKFDDGTVKICITCAMNEVGLFGYDVRCEVILNMFDTVTDGHIGRRRQTVP